MTGRSLVVRADATPEIGAGHLMRCVTFAQAWKTEGFGETAVWGTVSIPFARTRLNETGIALLESPPSEGTQVLMVDNYDEGIRASALSASCGRLRVLVDDVGQLTRGYDVIWNPNAYSADDLYGDFGGSVISGEMTVPIRPGLPQWSPETPAIAVTLGGTRPPDWLVEGLRVWGSTLREPPIAGEASWVPAGWNSVPADRMWSSFAKCSMLVSSAGSTVWEAANVGIPLCLVVTINNQRLAAGWARSKGIPQVDALHEREPAAFAAALDDALSTAAALPRLESGARTAARTVHRLMAERGSE
jgi:hypothetical protein